MASSFSVKKAHEAQLQLSRKAVLEDTLPRKIRFVGGIDVAYSEGKSVGAAVVLDYESLELAEAVTAVCETRFPYVPTLLSFREVPPAVLCVRRLRLQPDVLLVDGHGLAHPYRCGFATHLGLVLDMATVGVAKSSLLKTDVAATRGDVAFLECGGEVIGAAVAVKHGGRPVYVSVGHMVSLEKAVEIVKHCIVVGRVPKPIGEAHRVAAEAKKKIQ
ncbi:MAG: endonuclease V [Candidatus Bathyarchaeota archaeon]|jgi:deoxyribonuclease V|nr:endonuclease V [Candidatus Bathyarchaeota archaeon]